MLFCLMQTKNWQEALRDRDSGATTCATLCRYKDSKDAMLAELEQEERELAQKEAMRAMEEHAIYKSGVHECVVLLVLFLFLFLLFFFLLL